MATSGAAWAMPRMADTYVFRDAQYFISHSTQKVSDESSLVLLHADGPNFGEGDPGGVTLAFAYGEADLLRRGAKELDDQHHNTRCAKRSSLWRAPRGVFELCQRHRDPDRQQAGAHREEE